jgi:protein phosphatase
MRVYGAAKTDIGGVRLKNEDALGFFPEISCYIVADGMGGHAGGQIASVLAINTMRVSLEETKDEDLTPVLDLQGQSSVSARRLLIAVERANYEIFSLSQSDPQFTGMGTTIASLLFDETKEQVSICHVGDSRVYRVRARSIEQLTEDHSLAQELIHRTRDAPQEFRMAVPRHILARAVGVEPMVRPTIRIERPQTGDLFVVCSDGVHGVLDAAGILETVTREAKDLSRACDMLIDIVNTQGGRDNSTVILLRYEHP